MRENMKNIKEIYCPSCGANLREQWNFDPKVDNYECKLCGHLLLNPNIDINSRFKDVRWFCDDCGACLNFQSGFTDYSDKWVCTECGCTNNLTQNDIYDSKTDYENKKYLEELPSDEDIKRFNRVIGKIIMILICVMLISILLLVLSVTGLIVYIRNIF